jgi:predicted kinase
MPKFEEVKPFQRSMTYQWYRKAERWDVDGTDKDEEWTELDQLLRDVQLDLEDVGAAKAFDITYSIELDTSNSDVMSNTYLTTKSPPPPRKVEFLRSDSFEKAVMGVLKDITKRYREIHKSPVSPLTTPRPPEPDDDEPVGTGLFLTKRLAEVNRDWITIDSSFISKIRYSELAGKLDIRFKNGSVYTFDVPKEVFDAFLVAPSKGRFFNEVILKQYARSFKVFNRESEGFNWYRQSQTVMDTPLESVTDEQWQEINDRMVAIGYDFKGVADVKRIFKKYNDLNGLSGLPDHKKVYDAVVSGKEYISKPDPKKSRNAFNRAIRYFGTTNALYECGYILPNGVMLDLSGKNMGNALRYVGLSRGLDHGEINQIMAMPEFIATGGIRHFPEQPGVEIGKEPSNAQLDIIYRDVEGSGRGYVVEIKDPRKPKFYQEYDAGVRGTKVISDIKRYYGRQAGATNQYRQAGSKKLYIMRGIAGSGKSTLAKEVGRGGVVLATDDFFTVGDEYLFDPTMLTDAHLWNQGRAIDAMKRGISPVVIDNVNSRAWEAKAYVESGIKYGYQIEILEPNTPWKFDADELAKRNTHQVPKDAIEQKIKEWEPDLTVEDILKSERYPKETIAVRATNWYKQAQQKTVSFDFDDTIFMLEFDPENENYKRDPLTEMPIGTPNPKIVALINRYNQDGWKVIVVTSRMHKYKDQVEDVVRELGLPIQEIYCTGGEDKVITLMRLGVSKHYDDDRFEISAIRSKSNIEAIQV